MLCFGNTNAILLNLLCFWILFWNGNCQSFLLQIFRFNLVLLEQADNSWYETCFSMSTPERFRCFGYSGLRIPWNFSLAPKLTYILLHCLFSFASTLFSWSKLMTVGVRHASPCLRQCFRCFGYSGLGISWNFSLAPKLDSTLTDVRRGYNMWLPAWHNWVY